MPTPSRLEIREAVTQHEVPTSPYWRGVMRRVRKALKVSQDELAELVGCEQPTISGLETGRITGSRYVEAICRALDIPKPYILIEDEWDERWVDAGRVLRARNKDVFRNYLRIFEIEAGAAPNTDNREEGDLDS